MAPMCLGAQEQAAGRWRETSWSLGGHLSLQDLVMIDGASGRLQPAAVAELAVHSVDPRRRRLGAFLQVVAAPSLRVSGRDLQNQPRTLTFGSAPSLIVRVLAELAPLAGSERLVPSFGVGYTSYVLSPTGCAQGNDSPLCAAAGRVHGAHGPTAHLSLMAAPSRERRVALRMRYIVTSAPDAVQHDLTVGVVLRPAPR
jgi:hypothetical protein